MGFHKKKALEKPTLERYDSNIILICPMRMDERQQWRNVLWYSGDESSRWDKRCLEAH